MAKYDQVHVGVDLAGQGGNAFAVMASVISGLKSIHVPKDQIDEFKKEAMSGDYEHLLNVCSNWVDFETWESDYG